MNLNFTREEALAISLDWFYDACREVGLDRMLTAVGGLQGVLNLGSSESQQASFEDKKTVLKELLKLFTGEKLEEAFVIFQVRKGRSALEASNMMAEALKWYTTPEETRQRIKDALGPKLSQGR